MPAPTWAASSLHSTDCWNDGRADRQRGHPRQGRRALPPRVHRLGARRAGGHRGGRGRRRLDRRDPRDPGQLRRPHPRGAPTRALPGRRDEPRRARGIGRRHRHARLRRPLAHRSHACAARRAHRRPRMRLRLDRAVLHARAGRRGAPASARRHPPTGVVPPADLGTATGCVLADRSARREPVEQREHRLDLPRQSGRPPHDGPARGRAAAPHPPLQPRTKARCAEAGRPAAGGPGSPRPRARRRSATVNRALLHALLLEDPEQAAEAGRRYLDAVDLQVIPWSQARLLPTLYKRMADLDQPMPSLLKGTYRKAWTQNQARFRAAVATIEALEASGIPTLVLKGAALVPAYGGDWGVRDMSDVDVLIDREQLEQAASVIDAGGWRPTRGLTTAGVLARFATRRHSWNFEHPDGHQLDLHWRVFSESRGPTSDRAVFDAPLPPQLGAVRARPLGDADLLLHVLEHASHDESASRLQWVVDAVKVLRATDDVAALADRLASQASAHEIVEPVRERVEAITRVLDEPAATALLDRLGREAPTPERTPGSWRFRLDEHRRGGVGLGRAVTSLADEVADGALAPRRAAWLAYVGTGRRPQVEKLLVGHGGPLTTTPVGGAPETDPDGWWHLDDGATVEALCGPGWSFPEPGVGTWLDGTE